MAATIDEAIADIVDDISAFTAIVGAGGLQERMNTWVTQMFTVPGSFPGPGTPWVQSDRDQRSVFDWVTPNLLAQERMNTLVEGTDGFLLANIAIEVVERTLFAAKLAESNNRITADQLTSVVTIYTTAWE